jgi:murein hydrolase activator
MMKIWIALAALAGATALAAQPPANPRAILALAQAQADAARQRSAAFDARAKAAVGNAERARAAQAAVAARIEAAEAEMSAAEARLAILTRLQREQERLLAARQQPVMKLVAALQTMARRPAAAALVQPGSVADLVHVRALLAAMEPQIAAQTRGLRAEVARARDLRRQASVALAGLQKGRRQRAAEQTRLAQLEAQQRRESARFAGFARLEAERAAAIGENTRDLAELVRKLGTEGSLRERLASLPGPSPRPAQLTDSLPPLANAAVAPQRLVYRFPVLGRIAVGFGESLPSGGRSPGVTIAARPGAIVVAPAAGRVTFAGLYRGYGAIAIIEHAGGYTTLITGLAANLARIGDTVDRGSPIGRGGPDGVAVELRERGRPVDLTTFVG